MTKKRKTAYNSKFNLCPGEMRYAPVLQINYVCAWTEINTYKAGTDLNFQNVSSNCKKTTI